MKCPIMIKTAGMERMINSVDNPAFILESTGVPKEKWKGLLKSHKNYGRNNLYTGSKLGLFSRGRFVAKPRKNWKNPVLRTTP